MRKQMTIDGCFKRKRPSSSHYHEIPPDIDLEESPSSSRNHETPPDIVFEENTHAPSTVMENQSKKPQVEKNEVDLNTLERDPGLRMRYHPASLFESWSLSTKT